MARAGSLLRPMVVFEPPFRCDAAGILSPPLGWLVQSAKAHTLYPAPSRQHSNQHGTAQRIVAQGREFSVCWWRGWDCRVWTYVTDGKMNAIAEHPLLLLLLLQIQRLKIRLFIIVYIRFIRSPPYCCGRWSLPWSCACYTLYGVSAASVTLYDTRCAGVCYNCFIYYV